MLKDCDQRTEGESDIMKGYRKCMSSVHISATCMPQFCEKYAGILVSTARAYQILSLRCRMADLEASHAAKAAVLALVMVITGSVNTIAAKYVVLSVGGNHYYAAKVGLRFYWNNGFFKLIKLASFFSKGEAFRISNPSKPGIFYLAFYQFFLAFWAIRVL